jgi:hypothetical protein
MKKSNFFAAATLFAATVLSSCTDTTNGLELAQPASVDPTPTPSETVTLENQLISADFEVNGSTLREKEYFVSADYVKYAGDVETFRRTVKADLQLRVNFSDLSDIYVPTEAELSNISLAGKETGEVSTSSETLASAARKVAERDTVSFMFDQNEVVKAASMVEHIEMGDTVFPRASVRAVDFQSFEAVRDEDASNEDSLVNNVTLFFNVTVAVNPAAETRAVSAETSMHQVPVSYRRIYKTGYVAPSDEYIKTIITGYGEKLSGMNRELWVETAEVWSVSGQHDAVKETYTVPFAVKAPDARKVYTTNADYKTTGNGLSFVSESDKTDGNWQVTTRSQSYSSSAANGVNNFSNTYSVSDAKVVYTKNGATVTFPYGTWTVSEGESTVGTGTREGSYTVYPYSNNIDYIYATSEESYRGSAEAKASIYITYEEPKDEFVKTTLVSSSDVIDGGDRVITITTQDEYSVSGQQDPITETIRLPFAFTSPAAQTIYASDASFKTTSNGQKTGSETTRSEGNFSVSTIARTYSSTASNGVKSFDNTYKMSDSKVAYVRNDVSLSFEYGTWSVVEGNTTIGSATESGNYNVYPYTNNVSYVYAVSTDQKASGKGVAKASIYVEKPAEQPEQPSDPTPSTPSVIDKIIPEAWGTIVGAGISAVPSDDLGEGTNVAKKCLTIRTDKGAVAVVFDWNGEPSTDGVLSGYFVNGTFDETYNSGYWTTSKNHGNYSLGKWAPARACDGSDCIAYFVESTCVRSVLNSTLRMWGWANGTSTVVSGYTLSVDENGTLSVAHNGNVVMTIR